MANTIPLDDKDIVRLNNYASTVGDAFRAEFSANEERFARWEPLLTRFTKAIAYVLENGRIYFRAVDEAHNELCIASAILANRDPRIVRLDYEPPLPRCVKSIDFRATDQDGKTFYVDVKTIKPEDKDRWQQYEKAQQEHWLAENVHVALTKEGLGGEIWHSMFAARSRMREYTLEFETKIAQAKLTGDSTRSVMAFCGAGFHWYRDELEDFVSFYFQGRHRADDPFSQIESKYMADKDLHFARTINSFACMRRPQFTLRPELIHWNVRPPKDMFV